MKAIISIIILFGLLSCSVKENHQSEKRQSSAKQIEATKSQSWTNFIALVKLKTPAILEVSKVVNNSAEVRDWHLAKIKKEQERFIKRLKYLSPEVKILNTYKLVLNGVAFKAPKSIEKEVKAFSSIAYIENQTVIKRPMAIQTQVGADDDEISFLDANSSKFIGAEKAREIYGLSGKGISVGIVDTGIDYTHKMFGGPGTKAAYAAIDPALTSDLYPNKKVVAGVDLVGTDFNSASGDFSKHIPKPDNNPLDEGGHGSHVGGTVSGLGDGVKTYDGVAPNADLHAIKVFGKNGSTSDIVVVAALEYSADPNGDLNPSDRLDIINMSLGSPYGKPVELYKEAVRNLVRGGTFVVASAGNSGHTDNITGSPGSVKEALSVAASTDNMQHNWQFNAVKIHAPSLNDQLVEAVEGSISRPVSKLESQISEKFVFIGLADKPIEGELADKLSGNIALIDRGAVTFLTKLQHAFDAGAVGAVVVNSRAGDPISMGGNGKVEIPAIMIRKSLGDIIKSDMENGDVNISFKTDEKIKKPELIDTLTSFSSKGPRLGDSLLKPEISAPGYNIVSADMGDGDLGKKMSGTSMAAPHMAGVMALMIEKFPKLKVKELKNIVMHSSKIIADKTAKRYPVSMQGAGRVQVLAALSAQVVVNKSSLSFGNIKSSGVDRRIESFKVKNITDKTINVNVNINAKGDIKPQLIGPDNFELLPGRSRELHLQVTIESSKIQEKLLEVDGVVELQTEETLSRVPYLAVIDKASEIKIKKNVNGELNSFQFTNKSQNSGRVAIFNQLGVDAPKRDRDGRRETTRSRSCDLKQVGHRVITKTVGNEEKQLLQFAVELYRQVSHWHVCEISVQIDKDLDGVSEQELLGINYERFPGLDGEQFASLLLDAKAARLLRKDFELKSRNNLTLREDYKASILDSSNMIVNAHSKTAIIEVDLSKVAKLSDGQVRVKVGVFNEDAASIEAVDYLGEGWLTIDITKSTLDTKEVIEVGYGPSYTEVNSTLKLWAIALDN